MGDPVSLGYLTPYMFMRVEPLVEITPVIASQIVADYFFGAQGRDMVRRAVRLYIPRTYRILAEGYDVLVLSDATLRVFNAYHVVWMADAVLDDGLGLVMAGGVESFHSGGWDVTVVEDVLPVESISDSTGPGFGEILEPEHELMSSIPWEQGGFDRVPFGGSNAVALRPSAIELARLVVTLGGTNPMMSYHDIGKGRTFAFAPDWTWGWGGAFSEWEYYGDFTSNLMLFLARQPVPQDIELLHAARKQLLNLDISRGLLVSLFDFVEKFGANTASLDRMLDEVDSLKREADRLYIQHEFESALEITVQAIEAATRAEEAAVRLKSTALFWIYVIEWFVVTATALISGMMVWTLMVRRRYFRDVRSTRFVGRGGP
jgi:uncharacterized membrane protein